MTFFYNYLFHPITTLKGIKELPLLWVWASIFVSIVVSAARLSYVSPFSFLFSYALLLFLLILMAVIIDFIAQLFSFKANSKQLFYGLAISHIPYVVGLPLQQLSQLIHNDFILFFVSLAQLALFIYVIYLQVKTIQILYGSSDGMALFLFLSPALGVLLLVVSPFALLILSSFF